MRKFLVMVLAIGFSATLAQAAVKDYIVVLQKAPIAKVAKADLHGKTASLQKKIVMDEQAKVRTFVEKELKGKVKTSVALVLNAMLVSMDEADVSKLLSQPDVVRVVENKIRYHLNLDMADRVSGMNVLREHLDMVPSDTGKGIKIGILDTGIDITNPMFDDTGYTYPEGFDPGATSDSSLTNNKVIVAKNFGDDNNANDHFGHGTAGASAAAGREVDMSWGNFSFTLKGSAPGAYLGNYKIFNHNDPQTGQPGASNFAIIAGINAAAADGMDIINLSLGGTATQSAADDLEVQAIETAVQGGTVVCISSGNEGYTVDTNADGSAKWETFKLAESSVSTPGIAPSAVTVGAVENGRTLRLVGAVSSGSTTVPESLQDFTYGVDTRVAQTLGQFGPYPVVNIENLGVAAEGCDSFGSVDLTGKIALIKRGTCYFCQKIYNAEQAGAIGVIVYNYIPDGTTLPNGQSGGILNMDMTGIDCAPYPNTIPGYFIRLEEANQIIQMLQNGDDVQAFFGGTYPDQTSGYKSTFSSYGPTSIDYNLKPDVAAIGNQLTLATQTNNDDDNTMYDESGFTVLAAGTSFSSPLTAGYMAVVKQLFPALTAPELKGVLCSTADFTQNYFQTERGLDYLSFHSGLASTVFTGSGRVDMARAMNAKITVVPNSIGFGKVDVSAATKAGTTVSADVTVKNISNVDITLVPSMIKLVDNSQVTASLASTADISLAAGESATVTLNVTYQAPVYSDLQGYIQFYDNYGNNYTVPYYGRFRDEADLPVSNLSDDDADGVQKSDELYVHSDPFVADTDNDGTNDGDELNATPSTDPANATDSPTIPSYVNKIYVPLTVTDFDREIEVLTDIYVVNPNSSVAKVAVLFYNKEGELVQTPLTRSLEANGWRLFPADNNLDPSDQGWAVVMSNRQVKAFTNIQQLYASGEVELAVGIPGTSSLSTNLYVPHIAEQTEQWDTMLSVVNPGDDTLAAQFTPQGGTALDIPDFGSSHSSNMLDVIGDLYNGSYPFSPSEPSHWWGQVSSTGAGVLGMEIFSQENANLNQAAGLLLNGDSSTEIIIPHVETSWLWWTGIALNNPNASTVTVTFTPYDDSGTALTAVTFTMAAGEKLAKLVQSFWADGEYPDGVRWIKITSDAGITGYELFGIDSSHDASSKDALAGIEALPSSGAGTTLVYPYTPKVTSRVWSGIVLLNAGSGIANVTINGYNALGEQVAHTTKLLGAGRRVVSVVGGTGADDIFSSSSDDIRWIKATSDVPILGFELFGGQNFMYLSGVNALQ